MKLLLTYDIQETKVRTRLSTLLESYGRRVNYSVFELDIKQHKLKELLTDIEQFGTAQDSIRLYYFCEESIAKSIELRARPQPFVKERAYVD